MKINAPDTLFQRLQADRMPAERSSTAPTAFGDVLKQTLGQAAGTASGGVVSGTTPTRPPTAGAESPAMNRLEHFLDLLDGYRQQLADPRVSLKGLDPLVREMQTRVEQLAPLGDGLPQGDGLKDVIQRTLVAASVEILRFRRGDYLPT